MKRQATAAKQRFKSSRRTIIAICGSVAVHILVLALLLALRQAEPRAAYPIVDIQVIEKEPTSKPRAASATAAKSNEDPAAPVQVPRERSRIEAKKIRKSQQKIGPALADREDVSPPAQAAPLPALPSPQTLPLDPLAIAPRLDWADYEALYGDQGEQEREKRDLHRRAARKKSAGFGKLTPLVLHALNTHRGWSALSDAEQLGSRQLVFAEYIALLNRRIAPRFESFLNSLDTPFDQMHAKIQGSALGRNPFYVPPPPAPTASSPGLESSRQGESMFGYSSSSPWMDHSLAGAKLADVRLHVQVEFEVTVEGEVSEARVVKSSGVNVFDASAVSSIVGPSPFPPPPADILSYNSRVYLRWNFFRDRRQNRPSNAEPLILKPPRTPQLSLPDASVGEEG